MAKKKAMAASASLPGSRKMGLCEDSGAALLPRLRALRTTLTGLAESVEGVSDSICSRGQGIASCDGAPVADDALFVLGECEAIAGRIGDELIRLRANVVGP